jgi:hypothetical protein
MPQKNDTPQMKAIREYWAKYKAQYRAKKKLTTTKIKEETTE